MRALLRFFIKYPVAGNTVMFVTFCFGFLAFQQLKTTFFPPVSEKIINIEVAFPGASPEETEKGVVLKIEDNLKGLTGIERISSTASENFASIVVEVERNHESEKILQDVKNAVDKINSFPVNTEPPVVYLVENLNESISFALFGDVDLRELKRRAQLIESDLRAVPGISKVFLKGFPDEEIEIALNETALRSFGISAEEISAAVGRANLEITGGTIKGERKEMLIRARNKQYYADELSEIVVRSGVDGELVRLGDVATLRDTWKDDPTRSYFNGKRSVVIEIKNTKEEDVIAIANFIKGYIEEFNSKNEELQAEVLKDWSIVVQQRKELLTKNGLIGLLLVLVFLSLFLNVRLAFWVAIGLPVAFMGLFIIGAQMGLTLNVISMFGMILVIGILVDDGIVIAENIYQHFENGKPPLKAAIDGTLQVLPAVLSAILTTSLAFSIFFFLEGGIGDFISDMAFVVVVTLLFSLVEALLILPAHIGHSKALNRKAKQNIIERSVGKLIDWLKFRTYEPVLKFSLKNKFLSVCIPIAIFMISMGMIEGDFVKTTFFPTIDRDDTDIVLSMPAGTNWEITKSWLDQIEEKSWEVNEELKAERADGKDVIVSIAQNIQSGGNSGVLNIALLDGETRNLETPVINNAIRAKMGEIPGAESVVYGRLSIFGKPIDISLQSNNLKELQAATILLETELNSLSSVKDVVISDKAGLDEIVIRLKEKAYQIGLSEFEILNQVRTGFFGKEIQRLQRGTDEVKVWVRYGQDERASLSNLEEMYIRTQDGGSYPLSELVYFEKGPGILNIKHLYGKREIRIEADIADKTVSASAIIGYLQSAVVPQIYDRFETVSATFEGQVRSQLKMASSGSRVGPVIMILIVGVIIFTFRSVLQTAAVLVLIPFGFIGVIWGHFIHDLHISVLSFYGMIALVGIIVNDALVLITAVNSRLREGQTFQEAVYQGALSRFRPILLTSVTTILGLAPLIFETSLQAKFLIPMAISVAYGLMVATFLCLLLLPVLLVIINRLRQFTKWWWYGGTPTPESVEPAVRELQYVEETNE